MILINEWLPNPAGPDAKGEFVELYNNASSTVNLRGWTLKTESGKKSSLSGTIGPRQYLVLKKTETKLALKNNGGSLFLYAPDGKLADQSTFLGSAPEGQSFCRINEVTDTSQHFVFASPTPGMPNKISLNNTIAQSSYPIGVPLNQPSLGVFAVSGMAFGIAVVLASIMLYSIKQDESLSKLLFGRDEEVW